MKDLIEPLDAASGAAAYSTTTIEVGGSVADAPPDEPEIGDAMFSVIHSDGSGEENPTLDSLSALYDELQSADREHGDVAVVHEDTGWSLSAHRDGRLVFEHLGQGGERHMFPVSKERVLELWRRLIDGDIDGLIKEPWRPGYVDRSPSN